ncbi:hypothetical protein KAW96_01570 [candidate division WOR-3 bacterium]|nr:hypothetical protein [candidate division WOR-3 bacterium]
MRSIQQRVVDDLVKVISEDKDLKKQIKEEPEKAIKKAAEKVSMPDPLKQDKWIYRMVVFSLGVTLFCSVIGAIIIVINGGVDKVPDILIAIGSAAVGALAGLLAPSPKGTEG